MSIIHYDEELLIVCFGPNPGELLESKALVCFDLDHTLVKPTDGKTHSVTADDWEFLPTVDNKQSTLNFSNPTIVFTNQGGISSGKTTIETFLAKIKNIFTHPRWLQHNISVWVFAAIGSKTKNPRHRKPFPTMFDRFRADFAPDLIPSKCVYVGDAAGRTDDFDDTDLKFAMNCGMIFMEPEVWNRGSWKVKIDQGQIVPTYPAYVDNCCSLSLVFDIANPINIAIANRLQATLAYLNSLTNVVVLYVGSPACGKSTFTEKLVSMQREYYVISQDSIAKDRTGRSKPGTKHQCLKKLAEVYTHTQGNSRFIIDATHADVASRAEYIKFAHDHKMTIVCIHFDIPMDLSKWLNNIRSYCGGKYIPEIAFGVYRKKFVDPNKDEGFDDIIKINCVFWDSHITPTSVLRLKF